MRTRCRVAEAMPLWQYLAGSHGACRAAGADDEHRQWRRACRQQRRRAGVHDSAGRPADVSPKRCARARKSSMRSRSVLKAKGLNTAVGDEGGFAPDLNPTNKPSKPFSKPSPRPVMRPARTSSWPRCGQFRVLRERHVRPGRRGQEDVFRRVDRVLRRLVRQISDHHHRGRRRRAGSRRLEGADRRNSARRSSSSATTTSSPIRRSSAPASPTASPMPILIKVNQIGTLERNAGNDPDGAFGELRGRRFASLRRNRGHHHRRHRRGHRRRRRSRPVRCAVPTAWPSTTSCCASRKRSARPRSTLAARRSRTCRA